MAAAKLQKGKGNDDNLDGVSVGSGALSKNSKIDFSAVFAARKNA